MRFKLLKILTNSNSSESKSNGIRINCLMQKTATKKSCDTLPLNELIQTLILPYIANTVQEKGCLEKNTYVLFRIVSESLEKN